MSDGLRVCAASAPCNMPTQSQVRQEKSRQQNGSANEPRVAKRSATVDNSSQTLGRRRGEAAHVTVSSCVCLYAISPSPRGSGRAGRATHGTAHVHSMAHACGSSPGDAMDGSAAPFLCGSAPCSSNSRSLIPVRPTATINPKFTRRGPKSRPAEWERKTPLRAARG